MEVFGLALACHWRVQGLQGVLGHLHPFLENGESIDEQ